MLRENKQKEWKKQEAYSEPYVKHPTWLSESLYI